MKSILEYITNHNRRSYEPEEVDIKKLKVGDKVRVKSIEWYNENKDKKGYVKSVYGDIFSQEMSVYCGKTFEVKAINRGVKILLDGSAGGWTFYPDWLEYA